MEENRVKLIIDTSINEALMNQTEKIIGAVGKQAQKTEKSIGKMGGAFKKVAVAAAAWFTTDKIFKGIDLASDFTENRNKLEAVFQGQMKDTDAFISDMAATLRLGKTQMEQEMADMGAVLKGQGFDGKGLQKNTQNMVAAAKDVASFYNVDLESAIGKLRSGITGETEPLKALGINIADTEMEAYAQKLGYTWKEMDNTSKAQLRMNAILEKLKLAGAAGDAKKTNKEFAGTKRSVESLSKEIYGNFFMKLKDAVLPALNKMANFLAENKNKIVGFGDSLGNAMTKGMELAGTMWDGAMAVKSFLAENTALTSVLLGVMAGFAAYQAAVTVSTTLTSAWQAAQALLNGTMVLNPIGLVVAAIAGLAAGIYYAYQKSETFRNMVDTLWQKLKDLWNWLKESSLGKMVSSIFGGSDKKEITIKDERGTSAERGKDNSQGDTNITNNSYTNNNTSAERGKDIPMYAKGTSYAPGGMAIVGESGPELVDLPRGSKVINNNKTRNMENSTNVTLSFNISTAELSSLGREIESSVIKIVKNYERKKLASIGM